MLSHPIRAVCVMTTVLQTTNAVSLTVELSVSLLLSVRATVINLSSSGQLLNLWLNLLSDWADRGWTVRRATESPFQSKAMFLNICCSPLCLHPFLLSLQPSRECVLAGAGAPGCVLNSALMTATAPMRRSAATMDVDMSALHRTQVRHVAKLSDLAPVAFVCSHCVI